eukprot:TRINITY_DN984_c2_g1_i2.p1 TRINITY_DN984_c2_g1~~TRINITY_DN984_c2_g1_i2.p1  ORF type:complete len:358 (+),score=71.86 TRINITY_DN984_c2_g1_i2:69-1076(+)
MYPQRKASSSVCGHVFAENEWVYECVQCRVDWSCCVCEACFKAGNHEGHVTSRMKVSGGCCDCGDEEAWHRGGFCPRHTGASSEDHQAAKQELGIEFINRAEQVVTALCDVASRALGADDHIFMIPKIVDTRMAQRRSPLVDHLCDVEPFVPQDDEHAERVDQDGDTSYVTLLHFSEEQKLSKIYTFLMETVPEFEDDSDRIIAVLKRVMMKRSTPICVGSYYRCRELANAMVDRFGMEADVCQVTLIYEERVCMVLGYLHRLAMAHVCLHAMVCATLVDRRPSLPPDIDTTPLQVVCGYYKIVHPGNEVVLVQLLHWSSHPPPVTMVLLLDSQR